MTVEALEICATERPVDLIVRRTGEVVRELRPYQELSAVRDLRERQMNLSRTVRSMQRRAPSNPGAGSAAHDRQADIL